MNSFPLLAAFTICVSFTILSASFDDLREAPRALDRSAPMQELAALTEKSAGAFPTPSKIEHGNEGLLNSELAGDDPVQAWLDRYLTPTAN